MLQQLKNIRDEIQALIEYYENGDWCGCDKSADKEHWFGPENQYCCTWCGQKPPEQKHNEAWNCGCCSCEFREEKKNEKIKYGTRY